MKKINLAKMAAAFLLVLTFAHGSHAGFEPGYLVTQQNDTLRGVFKFATGGIKLKSAQSKKTQLLPLYQIVAYAYDSDQQVHYNFENRFYTLTIDDEVQLYERTSYTYSYNGQFSTTIIQHSYAVKRRKEDTLTLLRMTSTMGRGKVYFEDKASTYFNDSGELVADIQAGNYNKVKAIPDLVKRYNKWWHQQQEASATN